MIDCTTKVIANKLIDLGICDKIYNMEQPIRVTFGKTGSSTTINQFIKGKGLIERLAVSDNIATTLISDSTFTEKGISIFKTNASLIGISRNGVIMFEGHRDIIN